MVAAMCATNVAHADNDDFAYQQTNLVSGGAITQRPRTGICRILWGTAALPGGPFWIADNKTGISTLYTGQAAIVPLTVKIPGPKNPPPSRLQKGRSVSQSKDGRVVR
jgi:hypothetical protein